MDKDKVKEDQKAEDIPEATPEITPDMIHSTFRVLETEGLLHYMKGGAYLPTEKGWKLLRGVMAGKDEIIAHGHKNIVARDEDCFEITTNDDPKGEDSVIAVDASKGCKDLNDSFKLAVKSANKVVITIEAGSMMEKITAYGSPALKLTDANEIVVRKSDFIDGKTVAILADKSANVFSKGMKEKLKDPKTEVKITLEVK
jgi:hypothetical protein